MEDPADQRLKAGELMTATGLSYRQLHHWEKKAEVPSERLERGWRRYTLRDAFVLLVCQEFKEKYGTPLESLRWLSRFMLEQGADHFAYARKMIEDRGMAVFLLTDLKSVFRMGTDLDLGELFGTGAFRSDDPEAYFLIKINPILNRLLTMADPREPATVRRDAYDDVEGVRRLLQAETLEEVEVLGLLRDRQNRAVHVFFEKGEPVRAEVERDEPLSTSIEELLDRDDYQNVEIKRSGGATQLLRRRISKILRSNRDETGKRIPFAFRVEK